MKKLVKRWIAGVSAAALFVSAVGFDTVTNWFMGTASADVDTGKTARSTGFDDLEQDTDGEDYNTGYGLHTNKTARAVEDDGRTFDVDLESWYVGENPVDVATILDASGSMAWTVDTLDPLEIDYKALESIEINNKDGLIALQNEPDNDGYLPQEVVDKILDIKKTDDSKLSYADYKYYIYEDRLSVNEFVPLGYWDGGEIEKIKPIGYYPFDGTLENKVNSGTAKYIARAAAGEAFNDEELAPVAAKPNYSGGNAGYDLCKTAKNGGILLDVMPKGEFTISFTLKDTYYPNMNTETFEETPIIFIGNKDNYYRIVRGNINGNGERLRLKHNNSTTDITLDNDKVLNKHNPANYYTYTYTFNSDNVITSTDNPANSSFSNTYTSGYTPLEYSKDVYIIIAGNGTTNSNFSTNYIQSVEVKDATGKVIGSYMFDGSKNADKLKNLANGATGSAYLIEQFTDPANIDTAQKMTATNPTYTDDALNLTKTAEKGAIKLDAKPTDNTYTILFKVKTSKTLSDTNVINNHNLFYIGPENTNNNYYKIGIPGDSGAKHLHFYEKDKKLTGDLSANNGVFSDTNFKYVAYVINGTVYGKIEMQKKGSKSA